jgi:hypothetical protein
MDGSARAVLGVVLLAGCKGAKDEPVEAEEPLPTMAGSFDVGWDVQEDSCGGNVADRMRGLTIKLDQVATGLSVFVDPDIGWIPCEGSIRSFDCRWGNAPWDHPAETWSWRLVGGAEDGWLEATLTLDVSCEGTAECEECTVVGTFSGELQGG